MTSPLQCRENNPLRNNSPNLVMILSADLLRSHLISLGLRASKIKVVATDDSIFRKCHLAYERLVPSKIQV